MASVGGVRIGDLLQEASDLDLSHVLAVGHINAYCRCTRTSCNKVSCLLLSTDGCLFVNYSPEHLAAHAPDREGFEVPVAAAAAARLSLAAFACRCFSLPSRYWSVFLYRFLAFLLSVDSSTARNSSSGSCSNCLKHNPVDDVAVDDVTEPASLMCALQRQQQQNGCAVAP